MSSTRRMLIGRVWKGREIMLAVRRGALEQRGDEIRFAPPADAVGRIGRDVGNIERSERRRHRKPAAQLQPIGLVGNGVAGGTAAGIERCDAVGEVRRVGSERGRGNDRRDRQPPEDADADGAGQDQAKENSSQHLRSVVSYVGVKKSVKTRIRSSGSDACPRSPWNSGWWARMRRMMVTRGLPSRATRRAR